MSGDGPACATEWIMVARPPHNPKVMRSRPPFYTNATASTRGNFGGEKFAGAKPLSLMRKLVADYSERGDTIADCYAGTGTTLRVAIEGGRIAIGCEVRAKVFVNTCKRLAAPVTQAELTAGIFADAERRKIRHKALPIATQAGLFGDVAKGC